MRFASLRKFGPGIVAATLVGCGGGGGGGGTTTPTVPDSTGISVATAEVLEGAAGTTSLLAFAFSLDRASTSETRIAFSTASTAKAGGGSTGSATGGTACTAGVDYVTTSGEVVIAAGQTTGVARVTVCGDAAFEPTETLALNWSSNGRTGVATGRILNDEAGGLNGTGVATSFGRDGSPLTNSDADGRAGLSFAPYPTATSWQCTRDNVTGLVWEGKASLPGSVLDAARTFSWSELATLVTAANVTGLCGLSDWRLPTPEELSSLVDAGAARQPTLDTAWLPNQQAGRYWTSSAYRDVLAQDAWYVDFATGTVAVDNKAGRYYARLVSRSQTPAPAPLPASCNDATRFADHGDGTVTDNRTGLMWKKCAEGFSGASCAGTGLAFTWDTAMARAAAVNGDAAAGLGHGDWRLPTRAELSSIAEREQCFNPAINAAVFPNAEPVGFWTSTPYVFNGALAWAVDFFDGQVAPAAKSGTGSSSKRVRLVRAGQ